MFLVLWILWIACAYAQQPCFDHLKRVPNLLGAYRPQCNTMGFYHPKQCHGSTGFCWCVTPHGQRAAEAVPPGQSLTC